MFLVRGEEQEPHVGRVLSLSKDFKAGIGALYHAL